MCSAVGNTSVSANCRTESRVITAISSPIHEWLTPRCSMVWRPIALSRPSDVAARISVRSSSAPSVALSRSSAMPNSDGCASICARSLSAISPANAAAMAGMLGSGCCTARPPRRSVDRAPRAPRWPRRRAARRAPARRRCSCRPRCACSPPRAPRAPARPWLPPVSLPRRGRRNSFLRVRHA